LPHRPWIIFFAWPVLITTLFLQSFKILFWPKATAERAFVFVYAPVMLLFPQEPVSAVLCIMAAVAFVVALQSSLVGYFMRSCTLWERTLGLAATVILGVYVVTQALGWFLLGMALFVVLAAWQLRKKRTTKLLQITAYGG